MNLTNYTPKGDLEGFPIEVIEKMLYYQVEQGNKEDITIFKRSPNANYNMGGFQWSNTPDGYSWWNEVLNERNFNLFFKKYPKKSSYPKLMMVSDTPITEVDPGRKRVVFMEKCGKYLAWNCASTFEDAKKSIELIPWKYAKDIEPEPEFIEVTLEDVAKSMNIPLDKLRIKK